MLLPTRGTRVVAEQSTKPQFTQEESLYPAQNNRATPMNALFENKYYSQFTRPSTSINYNYATPRLYPLYIASPQTTDAPFHAHELAP